MGQIRDLFSQISKKKTEFKSDSYPMSIGELVSLYERGEIVINPDFQRFFRWTDVQKSRLIESLLLGIPIPAIFVFQREDGIWELVDGLQRVSTILQFMGKLPSKQPLILQATKHLPALSGISWGDDSLETDEAAEQAKALPVQLKLALKRSKLNFSIIISDTGSNAKFEVFQRLNTGGTYASDQEVRNSLMIMVNKPTYTWFNEIANNSDFINSISISDKLIDEQYPMELALRHIALLYYDYSPKVELSDFFDSIIETILSEKDFPYAQDKEKFEKTFKVINELCGESAFKRYDVTADKFKGKFLESAFEAVSVGIAYNLDSYIFPQDNQILVDRIKSLHSHNNFSSFTGSGSNARTRIPNIIPFAKEYFKK